MGRAPRLLLPDGPTHVYTRANRWELLYYVERDADEFLSRTDDALGRFGVKCWAYCLMPTHYHFILDGLREDFSRAMHRLNGGYARWFNKEHGYRHHVFGDRFCARTVRGDDHLLELARYVVLNPVRAGLCEHPRQWPWSSYHAMVGARPPSPFLTLDWMREFISPEGFAAYVEAGIAPAVELA